MISWFPRLIHLDDRAITEEQRQEAKRLFKRPILEQIAENTTMPLCLKSLHNKISTICINPFSQSDKLKQTSKSVNFII